MNRGRVMSPSGRVVEQEGGLRQDDQLPPFVSRDKMTVRSPHQTPLMLARCHCLMPLRRWSMHRDTRRVRPNTSKEL